MTAAVVETSTTTTMTTMTTTTTTPNPYPCGNMTTLIDFDLSTVTNIGLEVNIPWANCCALCLANTSCGSFTWTISGSNCYWKIQTTSNGTNSTNCISAKYA